MALPFSTNQAHIPIPFYDINGVAPVRLPIVVRPAAQWLVDYATISVINELGATAVRTPLRMFVYNICSQYQWMNEDMKYLTKLVLDLACVLANQNRYAEPQSAIPEAVTSGISMYSATILEAYPELKSIAGIETVNAARHALDQLVRYERDIYFMYNPQEVTQFPPSGNYLPHPQPSAGAYRPPHFQSQPQPVMNVRNIGPSNSGLNQAVSGGSSSFNSAPSAVSNGVTSSINVVSQSKFFNNRDRVLEQPVDDRIKSTLVPSTPTLVEVTPVLSPVEEAVTTPFMNVVTYNGENEVDREKHRALNYFRNTGRLTGDRFNRFQSAADKLLSSKLVDDNTTVSMRKIEGLSLNELILNARVIQRTHVNNPAVFRVFGTYAKAFICQKRDLEQLNTLSKTLTIADLAKQLGEIIYVTDKLTTLNDANKDSTSYHSADFNNFITTLGSIEKWLISLVDDFIANNLGLEGGIDSFVVDAPVLRKSLVTESELGAAMDTAFLRWENEFFHELPFSGKSTLPVIEDEVLDLFSLSNRVSLTMLELSSNELKINPGIIDQSTTPALFKIASSLTKHCATMPCFPSLHLMITSDDVIYRLVENYITKEWSLSYYQGD